MVKIYYDDENYFFSSDELKEIAEEIDQGKDLNVWEEGKNMIVKIAEHFEFCSECRGIFDAMMYESFNYFEEKLTNSELSEFICDCRK